MAVAVIGPTPGIVINREGISSSLARLAISRSSALICSASIITIPISTSSIARVACGRSEPGSSTNASSLGRFAVPLAATRPYSVSCPRTALISCVRWRTSRSRVRKIAALARSGSVRRAAEARDYTARPLPAQCERRNREQSHCRSV